MHSLICGIVHAKELKKVCNLDNQPVKLFSDNTSRAIVLIFVKADCPISNRYAPEVRRIYEQYSPKNVTFWLVYADKDETSEIIRKHLKEFEYPVPALRDPDYELVDISHARATPHAAVFSSRGELVYRGRIDNRYVGLGRARPAPTQRDLEDALIAILANKPVMTPETAAIGCAIPARRQETKIVK